MDGKMPLIFQSGPHVMAYNVRIVGVEHPDGPAEIELHSGFCSGRWGLQRQFRIQFGDGLFEIKEEDQVLFKLDNTCHGIAHVLHITVERFYILPGNTMYPRDARYHESRHDVVEFSDEDVAWFRFHPCLSKPDGEVNKNHHLVAVVEEPRHHPLLRIRGIYLVLRNGNDLDDLGNIDPVIPAIAFLIDK